MYVCICENVKLNKEKNRVLTVVFGILQLLALSLVYGLDPQRSEAGVSKDALGSLKSEIKPFKENQSAFPLTSWYKNEPDLRDSNICQEAYLIFRK